MKKKRATTASSRHMGRFVLPFVCLALAGGMALPLRAAEQPLDRDITYWVREALRGDASVDAAAITVTTDDGIVTLTGSVRNLGSKIAAVEQAKKIQGVVAVQDRLISNPAWRPDEDIVQDIRQRIANSAVIEARDIRVTSYTGKVTLGGHVASWVESEEAAKLAGETRGVREIQNNLVVDYAWSRTDQEIKNDAVSALDLDVYLRGLPITVAVSDGTVTLTGTVGSLYEKDRARDAVRRVYHVKGVIDQLKVDWLSNDRSRGKPPVLSDDELQKTVHSQLERDGRIDASKVVVRVVGGHVILNGSVPYGSQKKIATVDARDTVGVAWVTDDLVVATLPRDDRSIRADELFEIAADYPLSGQNIDIAVKDGVVTLTGTVHTRYQKNYAQEVAWRPRGVKQVVNRLEVANDSKYSNAELEKAINSELRWNWTTYWVHDDIDVDVESGVAYLRGHVDTWSERAEAGRLASHTPGVWRVYNNLRVGDYPYAWNEWDDDPYDDYPYGP